MLNLKSQVGPMALKDANVVTNHESDHNELVKLGKRELEGDDNGRFKDQENAVIRTTENNEILSTSDGQSNKKQRLSVKTKEQREHERLIKEKEKEAKQFAEQQRKAERLAEKQRRDLERDEKKRQKEEEKRLKDEEKRQKEAAKEEEKRQKEAAKEEEKRQKEEEKRLKEEEKRQKEAAKEEAKLKQERKQLRMDNFFKKVQKPKELSTATISGVEVVTSVSTSKESPINTTSSTNTPEFEEIFLPFHMKIGTKLYPKDKWAELGQKNETSSSSSSNTLKFIKSQKIKRGYIPPKSTVEIVQLMNAGSLSESKIVNLLNSLPRRHIKFTENIRPPYVGTFSKPTNRKMAICPCQIFPSAVSINYDYDSDYDWINEENEGDEEIGEDLGDDDESEDDSDDADLAAFVDDESDSSLSTSGDEDKTINNSNRRRIIGPLAPLVKWNNGNEAQIFNHMTVDILIDIKGDKSIDPFKNYWINPEADPTISDAPTTTTPSSISISASNSSSSSSKLVPEHLLKSFLLKIQGSNKNQILLVETLKIEFNSISKSVIRDTIKACAKRIGAKESDKRWIINADFTDKYHIPPPLIQQP